VKTCAVHTCDFGYELKDETLTVTTPDGSDKEEICCQVKWIDLTSKFEDEVLDLGGKKWKCCCGGGTIQKAEECTLTEIPQTEKQWWENFVKKEGCLSLAGPGMHSFKKSDPQMCRVKAQEAFTNIAYKDQIDQELHPEL
jgi:hypothetical protein